MTLRTAIQILAGAAIITLETIGKPVVVPAEARLVFRPEHVIVDNVTIEPQKTMRVPQAPGSFAINAVQQRQLFLEEVKVGDARHALFFKDVFLCLWFGGGHISLARITISPIIGSSIYRISSGSFVQ